MRAMELQGVVRGKTIRTTISDPAAICPLDRVNRQFKAPRPNALWAEPARGSARRSRDGVAWRRAPTSPMSRPGAASSTWPSSSMPMPGASSAGASRAPPTPPSYSTLWSRPCTIVAPSRAAGSCTTATGARNTSRCATPSGSPRPASSRPSAALATATINALAETINGLYKAEVIHRRGPWRSFEAVDFAPCGGFPNLLRRLGSQASSALEWVDWFNTRRLLEPIGNVPPAEAEARYYAQAEAQALAA